MGRHKGKALHTSQGRAIKDHADWTFELHVRPGHPKVILKKSETGWVLGVREQPRDGMANRGVLRVLADILGVPVSTLSILRGESSRIKRIEVAGLAPEEGVRRLEVFLKKSVGQ